MKDKLKMDNYKTKKQKKQKQKQIGKKWHH